MTILINCPFIYGQEKSTAMFEEFTDILNVEIPNPESLERSRFSYAANEAVIEKADIRHETAFKSLSEMTSAASEIDPEIEKSESDYFGTARKNRSRTFDPDKVFLKSAFKENENEERFHWKPAIVQSLYFLTIQHGFRMLQKKTTDELGGPFFRDWANSVKNLGRWRDGDSTFTNYVAHPMQGAVTGRIFINNSDKSKKLEFGNSKEYWESRLKAMVWSAAWSTQFEIGPISEASIGNVGLYDRRGPNRMGFVDIVITPTAGTLVLIGEDIIDKYILRKWLEKNAKSKTRIILFRTFITPFQAFTNVLSGKYPWKRYNR